MFESDEEEMNFLKAQDEDIQEHINNIEMNLEANWLAPSTAPAPAATGTRLLSRRRPAGSAR